MEQKVSRPLTERYRSGGSKSSGKKFLYVLFGVITLMLAGGFLIKKNDKPIFQIAYEKIFLGKTTRRKTLIDPAVKAKFDGYKDKVNSIKSGVESAGSLGKNEARASLNELKQQSIDLSFDMDNFYNEFRYSKTDDFNPEDVVSLRDELGQLTKQIKEKIGGLK